MQVNREYHKWYSPRLHRDMELLVFGHAGTRVLVFPTRQGRFFDYEDWGLVDALRERLETGAIQLYCVDSVDSEGLYCWDIPPRARIERHNAFEQYILQEVVPLTLAKNAHSSLVSHGCSIGAYHAVNIALRHPSYFSRVVALSGRYDLTKPVETYPDLFGGYYDDDIYFHIPNHFVPNLHDEHVLSYLRDTEIKLAVGEKDWFRESNEELSRSLWAKGIWHTLDYWDGKAHQAKYWREMVRSYF